MRSTSLADGESIWNIFLILSLSVSHDWTHRCFVTGRKNPPLQPNDPGCDEILYLKCSKPGTKKEFFGLYPACEVVWWKIMIIPIHKNGDRRVCINCRGISLLSLRWKKYAKCLEDAAKQLNQSWRISSAVFVLAVALQTKISHSNKFSRNLANIPQMCMHVLSTSRQHSAVSFGKIVGECCGTVLTAACYWPLCYCYLLTRLRPCRVVNQNHSPCVLDSDKVYAVTTPLHSLFRGHQPGARRHKVARMDHVVTLGLFLKLALTLSVFSHG